ncbi:hypothetical protein [Amycolatopsis sp. A1MSW2902]|uniref:hypothetical protein n=1 Tax=Amycolatopsis sp. A1MSW2902 TaxID=687413 RepID=UPI00307D0F03
MAKYWPPPALSQFSKVPMIVTNAAGQVGRVAFVDAGHGDADGSRARDRAGVMAAR